MAEAARHAEDPSNIAVQNNNPLKAVRTNDGPGYELPDAQTLKEAGECKIKDEYGREIPFKQLYEGKEGQRLIIFIRHFFCGVCLPFTFPEDQCCNSTTNIRSRAAKTTSAP